jgi:ATP/maltotriose-dependent transcriptional regulator MalT
MLEQPQSALAHIARGRWLWMQDKVDDAETEFRAGLKQARAANQLYRMQLAGEPLLDLLIERGELVAAATVLDGLKAHDPIRIEQSYEARAMTLRLAMAVGDADDIASAQSKAAALAGERSLPTPVWIASTLDVDNSEVSPITILSRNDD